MNAAQSSDATVLVVEDERHLADLYAGHLEDEYEVLTAYGGREALDRLCDEVDVLLLDRRMPAVSGNEVLAAIDERDVDCRVAFVTASEPDFEVIDLDVDDYLVKPVTETDLRETVERLLAVEEYTEARKRLTRKQLTRNVLAVEKSRRELRDNERFRELEAEIARLEGTVEELAAQLDVDDRNLVV